MEAIIKRIELKKILNRYYFVLEIQDINENVYIVDKPFCSDLINFRRQVFGIMAACNQFDLLRLTTSNPEYKDVVGYYSNGLQILENDQNKWFSYDKRTGKYFCDDAKEDVRKLFKTIVDNNLGDVSVNKGEIQSIESASGVFQIFFNSNGLGTFMNTGQIYYGFCYPIGIGSADNKESVKIAATVFQSFIISLMKFYNVTDLLCLGGKIEQYPVVEIELDKNNKISQISSLVTGMGLKINDGFEIVNNFENNEKKVLG